MEEAKDQNFQPQQNQHENDRVYSQEEMVNIVSLVKDLQSTVAILAAKVDKNLSKEMQIQASEIRN